MKYFNVKRWDEAATLIREKALSPFQSLLALNNVPLPCLMVGVCLVLAPAVNP